jgi:hypothetical protein
MKSLKPSAKTAYIKEQTQLRGPCLRIGAEVWEVENVNVRVGIVQRIEAGAVFIKRPDGTIIKKHPQTSVLFAAVEENE